MIEILAIINQKGGVGKSTTAHAIGSGFSLSGYRTLFIDLDAQCNLSATSGIEMNEQKISVLDVLQNPEMAKKAIIKIEENLDIIPATTLLSGADAVINEVGKEYRLKEAISNITADYDFIVIDTPPSLGILTVNALTAANSVIIPAGADIYSLYGISQLEGTIKTIKKYCNPNLKIKGILLTRYNSRAVLSREITEVLVSTADRLETKLFNTRIREGIAIKEAQAEKKSIYEYSPRSNPAQDYTDLLNEMYA